MKVGYQVENLYLKPVNQAFNKNNAIKPVLSPLNMRDTFQVASNNSKSQQLNAPQVLFFNDNPSPYQPKGHKIVDGAWFYDTMKTADNGKIHLLTVDPKKVKINVEFNENGKSITPLVFKSDNNFIAAINGQFYGDAGAIGDMKSENKIYQDEKVSKNYDHFSDKRYYIGITPDGQTVTGKGGISENGGNDCFKMFFGGMGVLYTKEQLNTLDKDIKSGDFSNRIIFSGASQKDTISRSFLGITKDGKLLLVAAGEGAKRSKGVNFVQAANLMRSLGAVEAYILDGGGSTSMLVKGEKSANTDGRNVKSYISIKK